MAAQEHSNDAKPAKNGDKPKRRRDAVLAWKDPKTTFGMISLLAFLAFIGYLSSQADSWSRLMATYNGFVPVVTAILGGVLGTQISGGRIKDAKADKDVAQRRQRKAGRDLRKAHRTLMRAQSVLDDLRGTHGRRLEDSSQYVADVAPLVGAFGAGSKSVSADRARRLFSELPLEPVDPELTRLKDRADAVSSEINTLLAN